MHKSVVSWSGGAISPEFLLDGVERKLGTSLQREVFGDSVCAKCCLGSTRVTIVVRLVSTSLDVTSEVASTNSTCDLTAMSELLRSVLTSMGMHTCCP